MKTFFDGVFISKKHLEEAGIKYPIKLEYYKTSGEENVKKYGIEDNCEAAEYITP